MPLKAYEQFAAEPLAFPIGGKTYTPKPIGVKGGIALMRVLAGDTGGLANGTNSLWQMVLGCTDDCDPHDPNCADDCDKHQGACGSAYDQMVADDVPLDALARAGFAMLVDWQQEDRSAAERVWESGIDPEARAALAAAARSTTLLSTPTDEELTTPSPGSGTTTPPKKAAKKPARRSRGSGSSPSGR